MQCGSPIRLVSELGRIEFQLFQKPKVWWSGSHLGRKPLDEEKQHACRPPLSNYPKHNLHLITTDVLLRCVLWPRHWQILLWGKGPFQFLIKDIKEVKVCEHGLKQECTLSGNEEYILPSRNHTCLGYAVNQSWCEIRRWATPFPLRWRHPAHRAVIDLQNCFGDTPDKAF